MHSRTHPADTTLILALDRELSLAERVTLDQHLLVCEACRARVEAFERTAREADSVCHQHASGEAAATNALRRRLQQRMTQLGTEWDRSFLFQLRRVATAIPVFARVGIAGACLVLVVWYIRPAMNVAVLTRASRDHALPIGRFTPGATSNVSASDLCSRSQPTRRVVSIAVRQEVLQTYHMEDVAPSEYELDYLITPELGGVGDARNLWPQRYAPATWNARVKDDLERLLPRLVCDGTVALETAQRDIADNWIRAYKNYFNTEQPIARDAGIVDDDDEILFVSIPSTPPASAAPVPLTSRTAVLFAELTTSDSTTARLRKAAWQPQNARRPSSSSNWH
jgi:anti-sigma factor RsiW